MVVVVEVMVVMLADGNGVAAAAFNAACCCRVDDHEDVRGSPLHCLPVSILLHWRRFISQEQFCCLCTVTAPYLPVMPPFLPHPHVSLLPYVIDQSGTSAPSSTILTWRPCTRTSCLQIGCR